jgi:VWFA-related protein
MRQFVSALVVVASLGLTDPAAQQQQQPEPTVVFKSGVEQVAVAAVVRDSRGRLVKNLKAKDFELIDDGQRRPLSNVWSEASPASVAILMDASGSMATKAARAREAAGVLVAGLKPGADEVAYFSFDTSLNEVRPFSTDLATSGAWDKTSPFGATSLWDAIAETAQRISDRQRRRALVVITDGVDSASRMKPSTVSAIASELDVPVYILVVTFDQEDGSDEQPMRGPLADLAVWTGGDSLYIRDTPTIVTAAAHILSELHHQYTIAFEPGRKRGWHPLIVRARNPGLFVRARSGYYVR